VVLPVFFIVLLSFDFKLAVKMVQSLMSGGGKAVKAQV
jgi:hypothetical protein